MRVAFYTLGCKVNQYETQAMEGELRRRGHTVVPFDGPADAYVINSCAVTAVSDKKSRQAVRRARKLAPGAVVAVCGCSAQTDPGRLRAIGVDLLGGSAGRMDFVDRLEEVCRTRRRQEALDDPMARRQMERLPAGGLEGRTRAMLKVEDGCVNFCTYCVIPYARGPVRSLPLEEAVCEAKRLAGMGYREIVVTGIEISSYGRDLPGRPGLAALIEGVCAAAPGCRVRLGSLEPRTVTEDFCARLAALPNLCSHFHLSLQSGCDTVLARMGRKYDSELYYESVKLLREYFPDPGLTTDLIVGFPGETEEEFAQSLAFAERCAFAAMHVFPYSVRPGTPAAAMEQVPGPVKEERARRAGELARRLRAARLAARAGQEAQVLFEERREDGLWYGHTPDYLLVAAEGQGEDLHNGLRRVLLTQPRGEALLGRILPCAPAENQVN